MGGDCVTRDRLTLFLCGDVMAGRGVDQILPHPGAPALREGRLRDARVYVALAAARHGPIPRPVPSTWPWGDALALIDARSPDTRVVNVETALTRSDDFAAGKIVHYRMSPANVPFLAAVRPDVCVLANNHVLDFGPAGLAETLDVLRDAGLRWAGAGHDAEEARRPATVDLHGGARLLVLSCATVSSGVPAHWAADADRPGVHLLPDLSDRAAADVLAGLHAVRRPGDLLVVSIHWGSNWGYDVPQEHVRFAHRLVDGGVHVVHGHSSHHPRPIEVYRQRLVLYGCGDLVDDYEGIRGYERYRDDLRLLYFVSVARDTGALTELRMAPLRSRRMRLQSAPARDTAWLGGILTHASRRFGTRVDTCADGTLAVTGA